MKTTTKTPDARIAEAQKSLEEGLMALTSSEDWLRYLTTQARFHKYSFLNVLWLSVQTSKRGMPLSQVAGFNTWKDMGRFVRKGEKALNVLAPIVVKKTDEERRVLVGFKVVSVFELSQTDGEPLPEISHNLEGDGAEYKALADKLVAFSADNGVPVSFEDCGSALGEYNTVNKTIRIRPGMSDLQTASVLAHEVAHSILHADEEDRHSRPEMETEAESTAFVVMNALGLDTSKFAFGYVAGWSKGDHDLVRKVADRVQKASKTILTAVE